MPLPAPTSVYVHVPFCVVKCGYCDFHSFVPEGDGPLDVFLDGLERELACTALPEAPLSVFLGGGTPSFLDPPRLARLFALLARHLDLRACPEVTMEANPESFTAEKGAIARAAGVNRLSMGAQSFHPAHLRFLDRAHDAARTHAAFAEGRRAGFANQSLDLIYSLPGQTLEQWDRDLQSLLALEPDHTSCYSLTFEPGTRLHRDLQQGRVRPNDDTLEREFFLHTRTVLRAAGFTPYEISNFAGRGGPCRHNDHYWLQGDYAGLGPGASSHRQGVRHTNLKALGAWAQALADGAPPVASAETLTREQRAAEALWLGIRRSAGVDLDAVSARLDLDVGARFAEPLARALERGWLAPEPGRARLSDAGLLFANSVAESFLESAAGP
ncbi:MAG: radical SAM family heme chaperone HemW [Planctomycetes bacterium]|nr:radical SAM family heme chaperone HemW [Planctomycetota bacterium]